MRGRGKLKRMLPVLAVVIVIALVLVAVAVVRGMRRMERASHAHLSALAHRLGATLERASPARLTGARDGRRFIVSDKSFTTKRSQVTQFWVEVPVSTTLSLQVQPLDADDGATLGRQTLRDAAFDMVCRLETSAPAVVHAALDDDLRSTLADASLAGELRLLAVQKQWLRIEVRGAMDASETEPRVTRFLDAALTLAGRLDAQ